MSRPFEARGWRIVALEGIRKQHAVVTEKKLRVTGGTDNGGTDKLCLSVSEKDRAGDTTDK
jgi:hypothetical protein